MNMLPLGGLGRVARVISLVMLGYWALFALLAPVMTVDSQMYNLARIHLVAEGGLFGNALFTSVFHVIMPWGFDAVHLPFKGAPEAMTEVIAGRSDFYFSPLVNALPLMKDGQLQALAVSNSSRASALPDIPTIAEAGYPNSEYNFWAGVFVPAKTPASIKEKLYAEVVKALTAPSVRDKLKNLGADPLPLTSAQFDAQVRKEIETNSKIAKAANIKVE